MSNGKTNHSKGRVYEQHTYLPMISGWQSRNLWKSFNNKLILPDLAQTKLAAIASRSSAQSTIALQAMEAALHALRWCQWRWLVDSSRRFRGSQNGWDIEGRLRWSELSSVKWHVVYTGSRRCGRDIAGCGCCGICGRDWLRVSAV